MGLRRWTKLDAGQRARLNTPLPFQKAQSVTTNSEEQHNLFYSDHLEFILNEAHLATQSR